MFQDFKPILWILLRFVGIYIGLIFCYQWYLNSQEGLDIASTCIAKQVCVVQEMLGYTSDLHKYKGYEDSLFYILNGEVVSRMVEGCNAISIMILFGAFIFAFYKGKVTYLFVGVGLLLLYISNVLRIAGINIGHDYLFPAIIYGMVVLLWIVWIKFFVLKKDEIA